MTGRFITFEGIDGAGKSTHVAGAVERLRATGLEVVLTREPGGTSLAENLREWLLNQSMNAQTELLLMFAARADHLDQLIRPALARGAWVICDRFTDSTLAYQGGGRGLSRDFIQMLADAVHADCQPHRTYYFDLDADTAEQRRLADRPADRFEGEERAFFERVRQAYLDIGHTDSERVLILDSSLPLESVRDSLYADLDEQLARHGH